MVRARNLWLLGFAAILAAGPSFGQDVRATILGRGTDASGAAVPKARVEVINQATRVAAAGSTNDQGKYPPNPSS